MHFASAYEIVRTERENYTVYLHKEEYNSTESLHLRGVLNEHVSGTVVRVDSLAQVAVM